MNNATIDARFAAFDARLDRLEALLLARLEPSAPANEVQPKADAKPKADVRYRSTKAKAKGRETAAEIWARHYAAAGVKRFKDLTPAQAKAAKAEVAAAWKGVKPTRKTKAA